MDARAVHGFHQSAFQAAALMDDPEFYADQPRWTKTSKEYNEVERQYGVWEEAQGKIEEIEQD